MNNEQLNTLGIAAQTDPIAREALLDYVLQHILTPLAYRRTPRGLRLHLEPADLAQETLVRFAQDLPNYPGRIPNVQTLVYLCFRNTISRLNRKYQRPSRQSQPNLPLDVPTVPGHPPLAGVLRSNHIDVSTAINEIRGLLTPRQLYVLDHYFLGNATHDELARHFRVTKCTVLNMISATKRVVVRIIKQGK